jgi:HrpA-like RNA helicase
MSEIRSLTNRLFGNRLLGNKDTFDIVPLHSSLSSRDQKRAFAPISPGRRKIILATNIAETSVTIPDVVCGKLNCQSNR